MRKGALHKISVPDGRRIICRRPGLGGIFSSVIEGTRLERFHRHSRVPVIIVPNFIEIRFSLLGWVVHAPVVLNAHIHHMAVCFEAFDFIGTTTQRRLQGRRFEVSGRPIMFRQHRHLSHDQRQFAINAASEREFDRSFSDFLRRFYIRVIKPVKGRALRLQHFKGPDHIFHGYRLTVMPPRVLAQGKANPRPTGRCFNFFRQQAIGGKGLVFRSRH